MTLVVINLESEKPDDVIGIYVREEEDEIAYNDWETGELRWAPEDCVDVRPGYIAYHGPGGLKASAR